MPLLDEVHSVGNNVPSGSALPPYTPVVYVPSSGAGTESSTQPALFGDEAYFYAKCAATDAVGNCVYANSTLAYVSTADASKPDPVVGIIVSKSNDTNCTVQRLGESSILFAGLVQGKRYFVGPNGALITPPFPSDSIEFVQQVGNALSSTRLFIQPTGTVIRRAIGEDEMATCSSLLNGIGEPSPSVGKDSDFYIDTLSEVFYGPKKDGAWGTGFALKGSPGRQGVTGPQGPAGQRGDVGPQGPAGSDGAQGPQGDAGPRGPEGAVGPHGPSGADGINGADGARGPQGDAGPQGPEGLAGLAGKDGKDGLRVLSDEGPPPSDLGQPGDMYYDTAARVFYNPKTSDGWNTSFSIQGEPGPKGQDGTRWEQGDGPPDENNSYEAGVFYFDRLNKIIYPPAQ